jgi:hypothetical protein
MLENKPVNKREKITSAAKIPQEKEKFSTSNSNFKNSILAPSPVKSNPQANRVPSMEQKDYGLVTSISEALVLQERDTWKLEDLDNIKINFDLGSKLLNFLKKLGPLPKMYKEILKQGKLLSWE